MMCKCKPEQIEIFRFEFLPLAVEGKARVKGKANQANIFMNENGLSGEIRGYITESTNRWEITGGAIKLVSYFLVRGNGSCYLGDDKGLQRFMDKLFRLCLFGRYKKLEW